MENDEVLKKLEMSFSHYYTIKKDDILKPFVMEAEFQSHTEQYFLVKAAKLSDIDSRDFVFFASEEVLSSERLSELESAAWQSGLSRVHPYYGHKNSDITLVIISQKIDTDTFKKIKKLNHYKSYSFGIKGWSRFRVIALEISSKKVVCNRFTTDLKKVFSTI